jgi:hypothetical protein
MDEYCLIINCGGGGEVFMGYTFSSTFFVALILYKT